MILVDHARPDRLGDLVRALLPEYPGLEVHTDVRRAASAPAGSTLVLVPTVEDAEWLNLNRPLFAHQQLRVILFCETEVSVALARQAVDFFDWISHREECPSGPPRYGVLGLRCAVAARAPGVVWTGGDLDASFAAARPRARLRRLSAALPYPEMVEKVREARRDWIAWTDVSSELRLWRVRWALIEAGRRGRTVLVEPVAPSPGWWTAHARVAGFREGVGKIEAHGARNPGRLAALVDFEPEAVDLAENLLPVGEAALEAELMTAVDPGARLAQLAQQRGLLPALSPVKGHPPPFMLRGLGLERRKIEPDPALANEIRWNLKQGKYARGEAEVLLHWMLSIGANKLESNPKDYVETLEALTRALDREGRHSESEALLRRALALQVGEQKVRSFLYARTLGLLARTLAKQGRYLQAEAHLRESLSLWEQARGEYDGMYRLLLYEISNVLTEKGKYTEAESLMRQVLALEEQHRGTGHSSYGHSLRRLAIVLHRQGKYIEAEPLLRKALTVLEQAEGADSPYYDDWLYELAIVLSSRGKYPEAESLLRQSLASRARTLGTSDPGYGDSLHALADVLLEQGRYAEAESLLHQALAVTAESLGTSHPKYEASLYSLAAALMYQGKYAAAEVLFRHVLAAAERTLGTQHPSYTATLNALATVLSNLGQYDEAEELWRQTLALEEKALGSDHPALLPTLSELGILLARQQRLAEGEQFV
ncbi:MAG TPA: tetratricopeptide repeat protein, partial [Myxococcaceae bacterium]|nr:tetratricopeptide repeat protein [Myxococcaceae bacterium]